MKRIQHGPVRGISLSLMEEEKEKRMEKKPEKSCIDTSDLKVDATVKKMLDDLGIELVSLLISSLCIFSS